MFTIQNQALISCQKVQGQKGHTSYKQINYKNGIQQQKQSTQVVHAVKEVFMPALSSTMTEGKVVSWLKGVGDFVKKGDPLVVVESDKADMDVESFNEGYLGSIVVNEGESTGVGNAIAYVAESEAELEEAKQKGSSSQGSAAQSPPPPPTPTQAPPQQEEKIHTKMAPSPEPAMAPSGGQSDQIHATMQLQPTPNHHKRPDGRIIATPYARDLAKKFKIDLNNVLGTGLSGRITAGDVEALAGISPSTAHQQVQHQPATSNNGVVASTQTPTTSPAPSQPQAQPQQSAKGSSRPFTNLEQAVSKNMLESKKVPEFRISMSICTDHLDKLYQELKPKGVTMTGMLAKACAQALTKHDRIYAGLAPDGNGITFHQNINIAVAVAMPDGGLITPVLKNAEVTDIYQLSREWADLVKRARGKKLKPDEYSTGNFSISNMGMFGVDSFDAMIQPGITSILAIGASKKCVVVNDDNSIASKKIMQVTITCDHRIAYGVHAAEFLGTLKQVIENPDQLLR